LKAVIFIRTLFFRASIVAVLLLLPKYAISPKQSPRFNAFRACRISEPEEIATMEQEQTLRELGIGGVDYEEEDYEGFEEYDDGLLVDTIKD
jgi:hypothetical protein